MKAKVLYARLDQDFDLAQCHDQWSGKGWGLEFNEFISENFQQRHMGIMLDNAKEIQRVYTAVFPSELVLKHILDFGESDVLLVTHHAMIWDPQKEGFPFRGITRKWLQRLQKKRIALYVLHAPLDKNGEYSTGISLARALRIQVEGEFFEYQGCLVGVHGRTRWKTCSDLAKHVKQVVGHRVKVWRYGSPSIKDQRVAIGAGGGNLPDVVHEVAALKINTYVTGVTRKVKSFLPSIEFHQVAEQEQINVIGATHYSTEKYACIALVYYFKELGCPAEFIEGQPRLLDLE